jgi:hypothetical protein
MDRAEGDEYSLREIEFCAVESGDHADAIGRLSQMTESDVGDELITEQLEYYRARAVEYDDWWERRGRYDGGPGR